MDAPGLTILTDAPVELADAAAGAAQTSQIKVARLGRYWDPRYGKFAITSEMADSWRQNLEQVFGGQVSIDLDHSPEKRGTTEAAGWIKGLRVDGEYVVADVEWTPVGESAIREKRYLYVSPTFTSNYRDEQGAKHGHALVGLALTNRPVLRRDMPALSLARAPVFAEDNQQLDEADLSDEDVTFLDRFDGDTALANWVSKRGGLPHPIHELVKDLKDSGHDESKAVAIAVSQAKKNCARGVKGKYDWCGAVARWEAMKAATLDSEDPSDSRRAMELTAQILSALGLDTDADEQKVLDAISGLKSREQLAEALKLDKTVEDDKLLEAIVELQKRPEPEAGTVTLSSDEVDTLKADAAAGREASEKLAEQRFTQTFDTAVSEGRAAPAMREQYEHFYGLDADKTVETLEALPKLVQTAAQGGTGDPGPDGEAPEGVDEDAWELDQRVQTFMRENDEADYSKALAKVRAERTAA